MKWIDEANGLLASQQERERAISEHETVIFEALWEELKRQVEAARATFPGLFTNGQPMARAILLPVPPVPPAMSSAPRKVVVSLSRDMHLITATIYDPLDVKEADARFTINMKRDGLVCMMTDGGVEIPYEEAAKYILRPFLYPQLPELQPYKYPARVI